MITLSHKFPHRPRRAVEMERCLERLGAKGRADLGIREANFQDGTIHFTDGSILRFHKNAFWHISDDRPKPPSAA